MKNIKKTLTDLIEQALKQNNIQDSVAIQLDYTRDPSHGDFACNIALLLAKKMGRKPRDLAQEIVSHIPAHPLIEKIDIAGAGFINFFLSQKAWQTVVPDILHAGKQFGKSTIGKDRHIHVEFVSSNPTGPLHVGHGRGAAYGSSVCDLLEAIGCKVHREYYVNDAGRQMNIIATSIWLRYLELLGETLAFPSNGYQGEYVKEIAAELKKNHGDLFKQSAKELFDNIPDDAADKDAHIDGLIDKAQKLLGDKNYRTICDFGLKIIIDDMREDLKEFGVVYQQWFSERELFESGAVDRVIAKLRERGHLYEQDGATWFRATQFGDDKDRVVVRENGQYTYFANDIAYHMTKYDRDNFSEIIDVLGADHHGYYPRIKAVLEALGYDTNRFKVLLVQFAILYRGKERVAMSTRAGSFVTLRELREEVSNDAARFFYVMRKADQHMDFDLELAKSKSNENPVYYIQYAHARICSVFRQLTEKKLSWDKTVGLASLDQLTTIEEKNLLVMLARFPETIELAALNYEPHLITHYLRELANCFHSYYNATPFLVDAENIRQARLCLVAAAQQTLANGLTLLGVSTPETM